MPDVHAVRRSRLADHLSQEGLTAAMVTDLVNVRYLTGFTGSNAALWLAADTTTDAGARLATDGRYRDQSAAECPDIERVIDRALARALLDAAHLSPGSVVAVETHSLSVDAYTGVTELLTASSVVARSIDRAIEKLRTVKDETEQAALRQACDISVGALDALHAGPLLGRSEREIARDLEQKMYERGAEAVGFDTIVATGPHSAIPHHQPTDRMVADGDFLKIDFGARYEGYHADCTRTVVVGAAQPWQSDIYAAVRAAQQAGLDACVAGRDIAESDREVRRLLDEAGHLEHFTTGLGHGVGLQIHEDPFISARHTGKLHAGTALTMEPGIYLAGRGGVRIEDTLVVTSGAPAVLTAATKDLLELP